MSLLNPCMFFYSFAGLALTEVSLEHTPPVLTLQPGTNPLHTFLGFTSGKHILSLSARDPADGREMPSNGKGHVAVMTVRGVRKVSFHHCNALYTDNFSIAYACRMALLHQTNPAGCHLCSFRHPIYRTPLQPETAHKVY